jgi:hypothetical protein
MISQVINDSINPPGIFVTAVAQTETFESSTCTAGCGRSSKLDQLFHRAGPTPAKLKARYAVIAPFDPDVYP